jgi:hypothetical protein
MGWGDLRRGASFGLAAMLAATLAVSAAGSASAASPTACRVTNLRTHVTKSGLQPAVQRARAGDALTVRGTCHGTATIEQDLTITGVRTRTSGAPVLDGDDQGEASIEAWCTIWTPECIAGAKPLAVTIRNLTIRDMSAGILNHADLHLRNVVIRGSYRGIDNDGRVWLDGSTSSTRNKHGIVNRVGATQAGRVTMNGTSQVVRNRSEEEAAGVVNHGTLTMNDASRIAGNTSPNWGAGGVDNHGTLRMNDSSRITGNTGVVAGGVFNMGLLVMRSASAITANVAIEGAGGVQDEGTVDGLRWPPTPHPNVYRNTPNNVVQP